MATTRFIEASGSVLGYPVITFDVKSAFRLTDADFHREWIALTQDKWVFVFADYVKNIPESYFPHNDRLVFVGKKDRVAIRNGVSSQLSARNENCKALSSYGELQF